MRWTDTYDIAITLEDTYPEVEILALLFTDLHKKIINLKGFNDDPNRSNERVLEAIQMAWLSERD